MGPRTCGTWRSWNWRPTTTTSRRPSCGASPGRSSHCWWRARRARCTTSALPRSVSRSEEHTSELRHLGISYAVFCLKKKKKKSKTDFTFQAKLIKANSDEHVKPSQLQLQ